MLRNLPSVNLQELPKTKCAEIFCQNFTNLTIHCSFCEIKLFTLEDFLLHLKNIHFDDNQQKSDNIIQEYFDDDTIDLENVKDEMCWENLEPTDDLVLEFDESFDYVEVSEEDEECLKILETQKQTTPEIVYGICNTESFGEDYIEMEVRNIIHF